MSQARKIDTIVLSYFFPSSATQFLHKVSMVVFVFVFFFNYYVYWWRKIEKLGYLVIENLAFSYGNLNWTNCPWESCNFIVPFDPNI